MDLLVLTPGEAARQFAVIGWQSRERHRRRSTVRRMAPIAASAAALAAVVALPAAQLPAVAHGVASTNKVSQLPATAQGGVSGTVGRDVPSYWVSGTVGHEASSSQVPGLAMRNAREGVAARFGRAGVVVQLGAARLTLAVRGLGRGGAVRRLAPVVPRAAANRVWYARGRLTEWYVNGPLGLEQGFTVGRAPAGAGPLTLAMALGGGLRPVPAGRHGLAFAGSSLQYRGLDAFDARGRRLAAWLVLRGSQLFVRVNDAGARYPVRIDPWFQAAKLTASGQTSGDNFGFSVAMDGDTIVVGDQNATVGENADQGAVYVFTKPAGGWASTSTYAAKLTALEGAAGDRLGAQVAISGDTVVATAFGVGAYVFTKPGGGWADETEAAKLTATGTPIEFGHEVAIGGSTIVVTAPGTTVGGTVQAGTAYVYVEPGGGWATGTQTATLDIPGTCCEFGESAAISTDGATVAVGGATTVSGNASQGAVYVFLRGLGWDDRTSADATLTASDGTFNDNLGVGGTAMSSDGSVIVSGADQAPFTLLSGTGPGEAYVFVEPGGGWSGSLHEAAKLTPSDGVHLDHFGEGMAISGDGSTIVVGAPGHHTNGALGGLYVFSEPGGGWSGSLNETQELTSTDGHVGGKGEVATSGGIIAAGAPGASSGGAAYVFVDDTTPPTSTITFPTATTYNLLTWAPDPCPYASGGFCGTAADEAGGTGVTKVEWSLQQGNGDYWDSGTSAFDNASETFYTATGTTNWSVSWPFTNFPGSGSYTLHVRATDGAGNVETPGPSVTFTVTVDKTPPTSTITFPSATSYQASRWAPDPCPYATGGLCGTSADEAGGTGVTMVQWSLKQGSTGNYWNGKGFNSASEVFFTATGTTNWSVPWPFTRFPSFGSYTLHVFATDGAGNVETPGPSVTFTTTRSAAPPGNGGGFNAPGNVLIADQFNNRVIELDPATHQIVWHFGNGSNMAGPNSVAGTNDAERVGTLTLIAGTGMPPGADPSCLKKAGCPDNRVILVNRADRIVWRYGKAGVAGSGFDRLNTPVAAAALPNGDLLITDQANERVIEVNREHRIVWQYGKTGVAGSGFDELNNPNSAELLPVGNILIADENNNRVIAVDRAHHIKWAYGSPTSGQLSSAAFASRLPGTNDTLITDSNNSRILIVTMKRHVVFEYFTNKRPGSIAMPLPTRAVMLRDGDILIADQFNDQVIVINMRKQIVWRFGKINMDGHGPGMLNAPYSAYSIGDYTGLTKP